MTRPHAAIAVLASGFLTCPAAGASISGTVLDAADQPVAGACVILCDNASGVPVARRDPGPGEPDRQPRFGPFTSISDNLEYAASICIFDLTDDAGAFSFDDLPAGDYKLIAQSWTGADAPDGIFRVNGNTVRLRGTAAASLDDASVHAEVTIKPLGDRTLVVDVDAGNDETVVIISTQPPGADPILGFAGWPGAFNANAIGGNRMPGGVTRFEGLPEATLHIATFSADNVPGWGAATINMREHDEVEIRVPFVAPWSDAVHSPPPRLNELAAKFAEAGPERGMEMFRAFEEAGVAMPELNADPLRTMAAIATTLDQRVTLEGFGEHTVGELFVAFGYARLMQSVQARGREPNPHREAVIAPIAPDRP